MVLTQAINIYQLIVTEPVILSIQVFTPFGHIKNGFKARFYVKNVLSMSDMYTDVSIKTSVRGKRFWYVVDMTDKHF